ncbi:MAG: PAS domain S-box protein [Thermodesulfobacteriota bacterium]
MIQPPPQISAWIRDQLFDAVPMAIAVIDQAFNLIHANKGFEQMFGPWRQKKCFAVYKNRGTLCPDCKGAKAFQDGRARISQEIGYNRDGRLTRYIKQTLPIIDTDGDIPFLVEMCIDVTELEQMRREYQLLFDQVPCQIVLIDRDFRIVKANARTKQMLGDVEGSYCFSGLKGSDHTCSECTARKTFEDGQLHTGHHVWRTKDDRTIHLHVITVPLTVLEGDVDTVMEMAVDVTQTIQLRDGLKFAHSFLETIVSTSMDGILALDATGRITVINPAARKIIGDLGARELTHETLADLLPNGFCRQVTEGHQHVSIPETTITSSSGEKVPVRLVGNQLLMDGNSLGMAFSIQDLREIKKLQNEKLEAERLAAVGQTVAGLAHGVKNLIAALEGGMYMLRSGVQKADIDRLENGMTMLDRNIERMSTFVKAFLNFSKGRKIHPKLVNPADIAREVMEMYASRADTYGIRLEMELQEFPEPAAIDPEAMHECLTNLVGNAIDACRQDSTTVGSFVRLRAFEEKAVIHYIVADDGCGMDEETRNRLFSTFFTTKGLDGTGLGLLLTKKIVQEHGGDIEVQSTPGKGSRFHIRLPRNSLPALHSCPS